ncbi:germination protein, Ger(x)C family [Mesobacillus persicus]|uniref:Germination protein, Ger(X)C family n=1 Tax=Mesobacillus persicus TaxID=930146 RepID=A0A1H7ZQE4_9BACI|nr:Ger(x)C family spore germination protein [Mesobacillus persicus]SEM60625.1 germination protein, Ger(x)C family [Mesobacillus persicus]
MKHQLKKIKLLLALPFLIILTGCWDQTGLDDQVFVIGIGMDKAEEKGKINITYLIANPEVGSSTQASANNEEAMMTVTIQASDFISMRNNANSVIAREISYDLLRVILVSEELAKEEEFIRYLYTSEKDREIKRNVHLVVTKEKAEEFFKKNSPKFLSRPHKFYENMIGRAIQVGIVPNSELHQFFRITEEDANAFLAIYATSDIEKEKNKYRISENDAVAGNVKIKGETNNSQFLGAAVFLEGKMIGKMTGVENRIVMLLNDTSDVSDILTVVPDPFDEDYQLTVRITKRQNTEVVMDVNSKPPRIHATLPLTIDVLTDPSMSNPVEDKEKIEEVKKSFERFLEEKAMKVVTKTQEEFKVEPFGWSLYARKEFKTLREYMDFDWMKTYPDMKIDVDINLRFGKFGKQPKTPSYEGIRD